MSKAIKVERFVTKSQNKTIYRTYLKNVNVLPTMMDKFMT